MINKNKSYEVNAAAVHNKHGIMFMTLDKIVRLSKGALSSTLWNQRVSILRLFMNMRKIFILRSDCLNISAQNNGSYGLSLGNSWWL